MRVTITPFIPSDLQGVKHVILSGLKDFGFFYIEEYDYDLNNPQKYYIDKGGIFYVLKDQTKIIGTAAILNKGNNIAELKRMYVTKEYQGNGYGSALLEKAIEFCKQNNFTKLKFETNKKFTVAQSFYKKHGFKIVSDDERSYYMEKEL